MIELSRLRGSERYAACSDDVMAHRPYGSAQTGMYPFALYCGVGLPNGLSLSRCCLRSRKERNRKGYAMDDQPIYYDLGTITLLLSTDCTFEDHADLEQGT